MLTYLRFDVGALVREYRLLAAVRGHGLTPLSVLKRFYVDRFEAAPLLLLTLLTATLPGTPFHRRIALGVAALLATTAGTLLLLTNTQLQGLPLLAAVALLLIDQLSSRGGKRSVGPGPFAVLRIASRGDSHGAGWRRVGDSIRG
jgi:hypothetical protein